MKTLTLKTQPFAYPILLSLLAIAGSAHADAPQIVDHLAPVCIRSSAITVQSIVTSAQSKPRLGHVVAGDGGDIVDSAASPVSKEGNQTVRMIYRPHDVAIDQTGKHTNYVDMTMLCSWVEDQSAAQFTENCKLNPAAPTNSGMTFYGSRMIVNQGRADNCRDGIAVTFSYGLTPDIEYVKKAFPTYGVMISTGLIPQSLLDKEFKPSIINLMQFWVDGFTK